MAVAFSLFTLHFALLTNISAHILKTDGSLGAVLHVDPQDDPIAGEESTFFFEMKDREGKFTPENCVCTFRVIEGSKEIYSGEAVAITGGVSYSFVFTRKDIYQVQLTGKPKTPNAFQPFTVTYDIRVERVSSNLSDDKTSARKTWSQPYAIGIIFAFCVLAFAIIIGIQKVVRNRK